MINRCTSPKATGYRNYGGRGIKVCDRWLRSIHDFIADMGERPEGMTIDRIDNDGNYEPGNCRWATVKQQASNRRPGYIRDIDGEVMGQSTREELMRLVATLETAQKRADDRALLVESSMRSSYREGSLSATCEYVAEEMRKILGEKS